MGPSRRDGDGTPATHGPAAQRLQSQLVGQLAHRHGIGHVLLVGKHQQDGVPQLVLLQLRREWGRLSWVLLEGGSRSALGEPPQHRHLSKQDLTWTDPKSREGSPAPPLTSSVLAALLPPLLPRGLGGTGMLFQEHPCPSPRGCPHWSMGLQAKGDTATAVGAVPRERARCSPNNSKQAAGICLSLLPALTLQHALLCASFPPQGCSAPPRQPCQGVNDPHFAGWLSDVVSGCCLPSPCILGAQLAKPCLTKA